jgi:5-formyltetrahydrofolate cyclo-ligase
MEKRDLRRHLANSDPEPSVAATVVDGLFTWMSSRLPGTVSAYLAFGREIDVEPLFSSLPGWRWVLPRVEDDRTVTFRDRDTPVETLGWGLRQPTAGGPVVPLHEIDLMLVPGRAFDLSGGRLGRGAGHYDRLLSARRPDCVTVGVTWSGRVVTEVPMEEHDQRVDYLATEDGVTPCSPTKR